MPGKSPKAALVPSNAPETSLPFSLAFHASQPLAHTNHARAAQVTCTKVVFPDPAIPNTKRHTGGRSSPETCGSAAAAGAAIFLLVPPTLPLRRRVAREPSTTFRAASESRTEKEERRGRLGPVPVPTWLGCQLVTMSGLWRLWDDRWRVTEIETLSVMGLGLGKPKLWSPGEPDETGSQGQGLRSKKKRVHFTFDPQTAGNRAAKGPTARVLSAPEKVKQLRDRMGRWAEPRPVEHRTEKLSLRGRDLRVMQAPSTSYAGISKLQQDVGSESK